MMKISSPADYFDALDKIEGGQDDGIPAGLAADGVHWNEGTLGTLERAVREYLLNLSPMQRQQITVHAPNDFLRQEHELRLDQIDGPGGWKYDAYLRRLASVSGATPRNRDERKTLAAVGAAMVQRRIESHKQRIKEKGCIVQCQMCAGHFHSADTERIKPYGSTHYQRFCSGCGEKVKEAKKLYQAMSQNRRTKA